jgi:hypothetical protein
MRPLRSILACWGQPISPYSTQAGVTTLKALTFHISLHVLPNQRSPLSTYGPRPVSSLTIIPPIKPGFELQGHMAATWSSDHSAIYRGIQLRLAIANDLSLAIGPSRIDQKVTLMQLGHQFNSYDLMHIQKS